MAFVACLKKEVPQLIIYSIGYLLLVYTIMNVGSNYQISGEWKFYLSCRKLFPASGK